MPIARSHRILRTAGARWQSRKLNAAGHSELGSRPLALGAHARDVVHVSLQLVDHVGRVGSQIAHFVFRVALRADDVATAADLLAA